MWGLRFVSNLLDWGDCDAPTKKNKEMRISYAAKERKRLEILIHEMLHAAGWHIDEEFITEFAEDCSRVLWKLGYRAPEDND